MYPRESCRECQVNDRLARKVEKLWRDSGIPGSALLPVIGLPSNNNGVGVLTHTMDGPLMRFNGRRSKSQLANNALYSFECTGGNYLNLYEIMFPDIPGKHGEPSTSQIYVKALNRAGIIVDGDHYHWKGASIVPQEHGIFAIHHSDSADPMHPIAFSKKTIRALQELDAAIKERTRRSD